MSRSFRLPAIAAALTIVAAAAAVFVPSAVGDPPTRTPNVYPDPLQPFVDSCAFPVQATILENNQTLTQYADGRQTVNGTLKVQLTNTLTGKSIVSNLSGPATFTPTPDGFTAVLRGRSLIFPDNQSGMSITSGRVVMHTNPDMTLFSLLSGPTGSAFDVCAALG